MQEMPEWRGWRCLPTAVTVPDLGPSQATPGGRRQPVCGLQGQSLTQQAALVLATAWSYLSQLSQLNVVCQIWYMIHSYILIRHKLVLHWSFWLIDWLIYVCLQLLQFSRKVNREKLQQPHAHLCMWCMWVYVWIRIRREYCNIAQLCTLWAQCTPLRNLNNFDVYDPAREIVHRWGLALVYFSTFRGYKFLWNLLVCATLRAHGRSQERTRSDMRALLLAAVLCSAMKSAPAHNYGALLDFSAYPWLTVAVRNRVQCYSLLIVFSTQQNPEPIDIPEKS